MIGWESVRDGEARAPGTPREARLGRYALWQLRDYLWEKGIGTTIVMVFAGLLFLYPLKATAELSRMAPDQLLSAVQSTFAELLSMLMLLGVLFATNGLVSDDRKHGYFRFLFAKPVTVPRFYAQKFVVNGFGFLLVSALLLALYNFGFGPVLRDQWVWPRNLFPVLGLLFVSLGGIGFLMSSIWRVDWLSFITVYGVSKVLWMLFGAHTDWKGTLVKVLPPVHRLDGIYGAIAREQPLPVDDLRWLVLYGTACFVVGLLVTRHRPLATS